MSPSGRESPPLLGMEEREGSWQAEPHQHGRDTAPEDKDVFRRKQGFQIIICSRETQQKQFRGTMKVTSREAAQRIPIKNETGLFPRLLVQKANKLLFLAPSLLHDISGARHIQEFERFRKIILCLHSVTPGRGVWGHSPESNTVILY